MEDGAYVSRMASQYGGQFESTLLDDEYDGFVDEDDEESYDQ